MWLASASWRCIVSRLVELPLTTNDKQFGVSFIHDQDDEVENGVGREIGKVFWGWPDNDHSTFRATGRDLNCEEMIAVALILYSKDKA